MSEVSPAGRRTRRGSPADGVWFSRLLAAVAALLLATLLGGPAHGQEPTSASEPWTYGPIGTIVAPHGAGVLLTNVATGDEQPLAVIPPVGVSGHAAWSPDGTQLAISRFGRQPGERVGGSDILVLPSSGGEAQPLVEHDQDGVLLGVPAWLPDSSGLFYDYLAPDGSAANTWVMYASMDPSLSPRTIATGGWPAVSPDGQYLAFVRPSPTSRFLNELVITDIAGITTWILVPADKLVQITSPRFSPDGKEIAFIGSVSVGEAAVPLDTGLTDIFMKGVMAHGPPGDVWVMSVAGGEAYRLTSFEEDEPTLAWSPDGYWIAMMGGEGMYLLPRDLSAPPRKIAKGGFGGIDWR